MGARSPNRWPWSPRTAPGQPWPAHLFWGVADPHQTALVGRIEFSWLSPLRTEQKSHRRFPLPVTECGQTHCDSNYRPAQLASSLVLVPRYHPSQCPTWDRLRLRGGSLTEPTPASASRLRNSAVKNGSRSWQVALAIEQAVHRIREVAADLIHPQTTGTRPRSQQSPPCGSTIP
jgi:hypothetical protein